MWRKTVMAKNWWTYALAGLWLFGLQSGAAAWNTNFSVKAWNTEEGLPQSSVIALTQSRDGYLWLGTVNGLARLTAHGSPPLTRRILPA